MPLILNIETATETCSVALSENNNLIDFYENADGKSHASLLTVFIEKLLKNNHISVNTLDAVAVSMGPGSYTGLRIGVSVAKGLCYGINKPLIAVPTLQSMAIGFVSRHFNETVQLDKSWLCPMIDARRLEVYTAFYDINGNEQKTTKAEIIDETSFAKLLDTQRIFFFGNGSDKCAPLIQHPNATFSPGFNLSAKDMVSLSEKSYHLKKFQNLAYFEPYYLKDFVTTTPKNKVIK